ncbi:MAG: hypothetical protein U5K71_11190 [Gracilimonas sp.]|nr:hypothetical protein [Gracilimonas sp.]
MSAESNVYFGELTNYPGNGFIPFEPRSMEYEIWKYAGSEILIQ